jgi:dGTP triphosphohydrolase
MTSHSPFIGSKRRSASHPDLMALRKLPVLVIQNNSSFSEEKYKDLEIKYKVEKEKNRLIEAQVQSLQDIIKQLMLQAEQHNYEALINEKKIKELEVKLEKEVTKIKDLAEENKKLQKALERVKEFEEQLKLISAKENES